MGPPRSAGHPEKCGGRVVGECQAPPVSLSARGAELCRRWELRACSGRPVGLLSSGSCWAGAELGVRVSPRTGGRCPRGASTRPNSLLKAWGHAGWHNESWAAPRGLNLSPKHSNRPRGVWGRPLCPSLLAVFAGTRVGVSHGGGGQIPAWPGHSKERLARGKSSRSPEFALARVELAAQEPGQAGVVQGLLEEGAAPCSVRFKRPPEVMSNPLGKGLKCPCHCACV